MLKTTWEILWCDNVRAYSIVGSDKAANGETVFNSYEEALAAKDALKLIF